MTVFRCNCVWVCFSENKDFRSLIDTNHLREFIRGVIILFHLNGSTGNDWFGLPPFEREDSIVIDMQTDKQCSWRWQLYVTLFSPKNNNRILDPTRFENGLNYFIVARKYLGSDMFIFGIDNWKCVL